jgi:hypothetical protein
MVRVNLSQNIVSQKYTFSVFFKYFVTIRAIQILYFGDLVDVQNITYL